jgi:hypothetical protein
MRSSVFWVGVQQHYVWYRTAANKPGLIALLSRPFESRSLLSGYWFPRQVARNSHQWTLMRQPCLEQTADNGMLSRMCCAGMDRDQEGAAVDWFSRIRNAWHCRHTGTYQVQEGQHHLLRPQSTAVGRSHVSRSPNCTVSCENALGLACF